MFKFKKIKKIKLKKLSIISRLTFAIKYLVGDSLSLKIYLKFVYLWHFAAKQYFLMLILFV